MSIVQPVKGTRDFYPQEMAFRSWLYARIREVSEAFGYQEYEGPYLERLALYAAKSGEELVKEQSFVFPDRGGEMVALRPELTPTLARMVAARSQELGKPIRWWSFGPFWRYERPQKGRSREFFQWNIDLLGTESPQADAEIASIAANFFTAVGLTPSQVRIECNDRRLAESQLAGIDIPSGKHPEIFRLIDRREKLPAAAWDELCRGAGLSPGQIEALKGVLADREAWQRSDEMKAFFKATDLMGSGAFMEYNPAVIRGLDYYTGIVFEAQDVSGDQRAILGGGRYDDLVADVGGDPVPGTGFAMGDVVLGLVLEAAGVTPDLRTNPAQVFIPTFEDATLGAALKLCTALRSEGIRVEWYPEVERLPKQLRYADRQAIPVALILGPEELAAGTVGLKDLLSKDQINVPRDEVIDRVKELLLKSPPGNALDSGL